ncbi:class I SAM-dependent methyltransferase [Phormidium tenue FACHB-886]|nr:class I SAM-dependent methyltransferase [Phormidium tenue FACHB-886]
MTPQPSQSLQLPDSNPALCQAIAAAIAHSPHQRITFAEFMDLALYHPQYGYYVSHPKGIQSDFFTSPHLGADFGELLAEQFVQMWELCDRPNPFTLVEMGAGQGLIVQDVLRYLHRHHFPCFEAIEYIIIEKSAGLIAEQKRRLQPLTQSGVRLSWKSWEEIESNSIVGCCFSNELVDAFPVHLFEVRSEQIQEVYVTENDEPEVTESLNIIDPTEQQVEISAEGFVTFQRQRSTLPSQFKETIAPPSTARLADYFQRIGLPLPQGYPDGYRSEVNLAALDWLVLVADRLRQGYLLTIDYGYPAFRYYSPQRSGGTLQCYFQHAHHSNPYVAVGQQDITAHVDFTALEKQGERCGLQTVGFTQQGLFLMALGLGDRIAALSTPDSDQSLQDVLRRRESLHALINPMGLGNFGVLVQAKGLSTRLPLRGLSGG